MGKSRLHKRFKLIMISAMYENGGNTLHRHLDAHPELFVYPYESQPGTFMMADYMTSLFPQKYRYPEFGLEGEIGADYKAIIDEEFKVRVNTPYVSKFRKASDVACTDSERKEIFLKLLKNKERTRANIVEAYYRSTFMAWKTYNKTGQEKSYVGYSPIIGVDADKIIADFKDAIILHIVRNPYAGYAETKRRPVPYSLERYVRTWNIVQLYALNFAEVYPENVIMVRYEDMVKDKKKFFRKLARDLNISYSETMLYPSWNGEKLSHQYPWGTIEIPTATAHNKTTYELSKSEHKQIANECFVINKTLGYDKL